MKHIVGNCGKGYGKVELKLDSGPLLHLLLQSWEDDKSSLADLWH
jgi:hypothetical protein